jgi:hypothetical protein
MFKLDFSHKIDINWLKFLSSLHYRVINIYLIKCQYNGAEAVFTLQTVEDLNHNCIILRVTEKHSHILSLLPP